MKTKLLTLLAVATIAIGLTGCNSDCDCKKDSMKKMENRQKENPTEMPSNESTQYKLFSQSEFDKIRGNKKLVIFFHADWCETCAKWDKKMQETTKNLPSDAIVLKANYDTEKQLVKDLHVKSQSSAVFFDEKGEIIDTLMAPDMETITSFFSTETMDITKDEKFQLFSKESREMMVGKKYIIFFYADWCGTCRKWQKNVLANLDELPSDTRILKANYDSNTELKKEFKITMQSTAAFVNEDGTFEIKADPSLEELTSFFRN